MDKSHLPADKFATNQTEAAATSAEIGGGKDDVVTNAAAKKEKSNQLSETNEVVTSCQQQAKTLTSSRGKDINEKKGEAAKLNEFHVDTEELLGSVTTYNCHGTRTSARVIQKMRQDLQTRPSTPPPSEREAATRKEERSATQKTPSQVRANRPTWSNVERNHFFDALNEFGKDFEAIGNFINSKLKRRSPAIDISFKAKDQVRQHYYQTYHKICKYVRFSEELRKPAQELYALINYGEMRRKLQFVTDKHFMKLKNLIYHGHVTVRCKGKNIRIKTPSCKALRRLNQLDDSLEDIRLPSKIEVIISPANMEAFGRVQAIAQNPRCRTTVPLHKKLINFINIFQHKWRSMDARVAEEAKLANSNEQLPQHNAQICADIHIQDPEICFLPKAGVAIHRPLLSITEYLSSVNICLTAYEERMGIKIRGEMLNIERHNSANSANSSAQVQSSNSSSSANTHKRSRTESGSEKKSPDHQKRTKTTESFCEILHTSDETAPVSSSVPDLDSFQISKHESSGDELSDEIHELLSDSAENNVSKDDLSLTERNVTQSSHISTVPAEISSTTSQVSSSSVRAKTNRSINSKTTRSVFKPLLNDDIIQRIRSGWTASTAGDITIGDLYVVLGHDSRLELDYYWLPEKKAPSHATMQFESHNVDGVLPLNGADHEVKESVLLSNKLKHLLLIANLSERMRKRPCNCERSHTVKPRFETDLSGRTYIANKTFANSGGVAGANEASGMFRQPMIPVRRTTIDPVKQLTTLTRQKMSRQILVQRLLLPSNNGNLTMTGLSNANTSSALPANTSMKHTSQVPWTSSNKRNTTTTSATNSTTISNNGNTDGQNLCTFLNSLNNECQDTLLGMTEAHTSQQHHQQQQRALIDELSDRTDGSGPSSVQSLDSAFDECSNTSFLNGVSPINLIRDSTSNSRWLEDNINDFSLTSLLGHLDDINASRDILDPSSTMSVISESSVDYMHKFQEIKALLQSQDQD